MQIDCPRCRVRIDLVIQGGLQAVVGCPACGNEFSLGQIPSERLPGTNGILPPVETIDQEDEPRTVQHFRLIERLGKGTFGEVWSAWDEILERKVALKIPRRASVEEADRARILHEARAAAQLRHPNIVAVHGVIEDAGRICIVCDLVDGPSLASWMKTNPTPQEQAAEWCATLAEALQHAHEHHVVHRDLKPQNVLIDPVDGLKIADFGLAKWDASTITLTPERGLMGTVAYMSPEQAKGDPEGIDHRTDVYSLGVLLYEMLCGERPFSGDHHVLLHKLIHESPIAPRKRRKSLPNDLDVITLKALETEPARRYSTAGEMADDLRRYLDGEPIFARRTGLAERTRRWVVRNPGWGVAGAVAVLAVLSLGFLASKLMTEVETQHIRLDVTMDRLPVEAAVYFFPIDPTTLTPDSNGRIDGGKNPVSMELPVGDYLVVAVHNPTEFHEVFRHVPADDEAVGLTVHYNHLFWRRLGNGEIELPTVNIVASKRVLSEMELIEGNPRFRMGDENLPGLTPHYRSIPSFYLDRHEVTVGDLRKYARPESAPSWPLGGQIADDVPDDVIVTRMAWDWCLSYFERCGRIPIQE
jgi:serine/threonine protein kinase